MKNNKYMSWFLGAVVTLVGFATVSCEDEPDKYEVAGGKPTINYVRTLRPETADSLLTGAYMANSICLVGQNLRSVYELYFNDQKATLNTSYMTDNTIIVDVPKTIPSTVTNKIYMITQSKDTVDYDFNVIVPAPAVRSMSCEYAKPGSIATIYGDYFIDDPNTPLTVTMAGNVPVEVTNITKTALSFKVPENPVPGYMTVSSIYGSTRSSFQFMDPRGMMFDFDGQTGLTNHGWHNRVITTDADAVTGNYLQLGDGSATMSADGGWDDSQFAFEYWCGDWNTPIGFTGTDVKLNDLVDFSDYENMSLKFEMCIPKESPWMAGAMQIIFAGTDLVTIQTANNTFFNDDTNPGYPRALYKPWTTTGSYDTNGEWVTVTIPFTAFAYNSTGSAATQSLSADSFASLTIFVWSGGTAGTDCTPLIKIDNIRAVPNN